MKILSNNLSFIQPHKFIFIGLLFCLMLASACHKEDINAYRFTNEQFIGMALPEQEFQQVLAKEIGDIAVDPRYSSLSKKRADRSKDYMKEIRSIMPTEANFTSGISVENQEKLTQLKKLTGNDFRSELIKLAMESDQQLIRLHVQASSSTGAEDEDLRNWVEKKLPLLRENLAEIQALK